MKEKELTSRMADVIVDLQAIDEHTNFRYHTILLKKAQECSSIVREFNRLVAELREQLSVDRDTIKLPALIEPPKVEYEN